MIKTWLKRFLPAPVAMNTKGRLRSVVGGLLGVLCTALISRFTFELFPLSGAWLVAPLGASAVLVFAAPASPLAQPWSVVGGNTVSAAVGMACAWLVKDTALAAALAVSLAIGMMLLTRSLHPPGGAMALLAVLVHAAHGPFALGAPILNSVLLVVAGLIYNNAIGRAYPHMQVVSDAPKDRHAARFEQQDLDAVLARYDEFLDVSRDDLTHLLEEAELESYKRRTASMRCEDVMTRDVISVAFGSSLQEAWQLLRQHGIKALPVIDRSRRIVGIVTLADFIRHADANTSDSLLGRMKELLRPDGLVHSTKPEVVGQIMSRQVRVVTQDRNITDLMPIFTESGHHHIPIIDNDNRLVGIITESDFVRALYRMGG
jgi:CBS domain-containing membrane protein